MGKRISVLQPHLVGKKCNSWGEKVANTSAESLLLGLSVMAAVTVIEPRVLVLHTPSWDTVTTSVLLLLHDTLPDPPTTCRQKGHQSSAECTQVK